MTVRVQSRPFDPATEIAAFEALAHDAGAMTCFVGRVRADHQASPGEQVLEMYLEHYPGMTEQSLETIVAEAMDRWAVLSALVIHRVGRLLPAEPIVLVAVRGAHRKEAFAACEYIIDQLKTRAPFWKKETTPKGTRWVEAKESDSLASDRWKQKA